MQQVLSMKPPSNDSNSQQITSESSGISFLNYSASWSKDKTALKDLSINIEEG
jgi:hypothetical protein